jgi:hypothetical protein
MHYDVTPYGAEVIGGCLVDAAHCTGDPNMAVLGAALTNGLVDWRD